MKQVMLLGILLLSTKSFATMTAGSVNCPQEFEGQITSIAKFVDSQTSMNLQKVNFRNLASIKGDVSENVAIEMLEYGPFKISEGEEYRVQLKDGKLCWIEKI